MIRLLRIEMHKLRGYRAFWILMIMYLSSLVLTLAFFQTIFNGIMAGEGGDIAGLLGGYINSFPNVWHFMTYFGGMFHYILAVIVIILICNEFGYKTVRQNVINGLSRREFLLAKLSLILVMAAISTVLVFLISLFLGLTNTANVNIGDITGGLGFMLAYFLQTIGYMLFAFVIGMLVRRTGIAIGITMLYMWFLEKVLLLLVYWGDYEAVQPWYPMASLNSMIPFPIREFIDGNVSSGPTVSSLVISGVYILLFTGVAWWFLRKRDL